MLPEIHTITRYGNHVLQPKGSVGKTTLSVLMALALSEAGRKVAIRDRDGPGSARVSLEDSKVVVYPEEADIVIIDTPPTISDAFRESISEADKVILVASPYPVDLWATRTTAEEINRICGQNQKGRILFNRVRKRTMFGDQDLTEIAAKIGMPTCKNVISLRESYAQAHVAGWRALPPHHRDEIFSAALEIVT
jgi:chromosome partitioning protein